MPLKKCSAGGKSGYKWGDSGKCFTGPGARNKALKQGRAIEANKGKGSITPDSMKRAIQGNLKETDE